MKKKKLYVWSHLGRGLRQGDPFSLYLFILCVEGMSTVIMQAERNDNLHGVKECKKATSTSHLLFTIDSFLFFRSNENETRPIERHS